VDCYDDPLDVLDVASNWLSTCSESHEACNSRNDATPPTRLVSIVGDSPRLILTSDCHDTPRYATLSHSWGNHEITKLTSDAVNSFMEVIPLENLPPTFKDAIRIARKLSLEYLWIDSLCIIQDSEEDWQIESSLMNSVYGGSTITIAASSARDASQGCFLRPHNFSGGLRARVKDGEQQRVQDFRGQDVYNLSTFRTHLGSRAWALQEKLLPPRTIHFSERGAFWECRTLIASEDLPEGFPKQLVSPLVRREGEFHWLWPQIVGLYSGANLTFAKDKLPALSGIAKLGHQKTGDQYLAGLWRAQIEEQLCWRRLKSTPDMKRPPWRAPSWSWASIDGEVLWYSPQEGVLGIQHAHVLDASITPYGHDPFGQVASGTVRLAYSTMATGHMIKPTSTNSQESEQDTVVIAVKAGLNDHEFRVQIDCVEDGYQESDEPLHLLPILSGRTGSAMFEEDKGWVDEMMIEGIVLRSTGGARGEFSRIGCFNFYKNRLKGFGSEGHEGHEKEEDAYETFLRILAEFGTATAEKACAETILNPSNPDERNVVTVV
jgi:hypothetical protein